jgi:hypothetical protein
MPRPCVAARKRLRVGYDLKVKHPASGNPFGSGIRSRADQENARRGCQRRRDVIRVIVIHNDCVVFDRQEISSSRTDRVPLTRLRHNLSEDLEDVSTGPQKVLS